MTLKCLCAATLTPNVNKWVSASSEHISLIISGSACEASGLVALSEDTFLALKGWRVPELDVFSASSYKTIVACLLRKDNVEDAVGIAWFWAASAGCDIEHINVVLVVAVNQSDKGPIIRDCDGINTSRTLCKLKSLLFLTGCSIPQEGYRCWANLAGSCEFTVHTHGDGCDIIGVTVVIIWYVFGFHINLATSKIRLCVLCLIQDHSESSRHINCVAIGIEIYILSAIFASVTIDVIQGVWNSGWTRIRRVI